MKHAKNKMKLSIPKGCDNAPRKQIVIDFTVAMLNKEIDIIREYADENVIWDQLKETTKIEGRNALITNLQEVEVNWIVQLEIYNVITHGKVASINGVIVLSNGKNIDFCDVYTFSNAAKSGKVKEIKSYRL